MSRLIRLRDPIARVLLKDSNRKDQENKLKNNEFKTLTTLTKILKPFFQSTVILCAGKYVSRSMILPSKHFLYELV